jgi:cytochrome c2
MSGGESALPTVSLRGEAVRQDAPVTAASRKTAAHRMQVFKTCKECHERHEKMKRASRLSLFVAQRDDRID